MTVEQVVAMATANPARVIDRVPLLGTLQVGAPADITLLQLADREVVIPDAANHDRRALTYLCPIET